MSAGDAPRSAPTPAGSSWRETLTDPTVLAVGLYAALALAMSAAAYLALFTQFAGYDDEGTLLVTLKAFANGHVLYRDIYSGRLDNLQMFLLKEFFEILEKAIDRCREAGVVVYQIVLKNS